MLHRLAFTAMRLNRREPQQDNHPLARADGGWYPGKHFDPTDILTDPKNWLVWKQFLIFFFSILCLPVATFLGVEVVCRKQLHFHLNRSTTFGAIASMIVLQALMFAYVRLAAIENTDPPAAAAARPEPSDSPPTAAPGELSEPSRDEEVELRQRKKGGAA